jgi:hypothetical protein
MRRRTKKEGEEEGKKEKILRFSKFLLFTPLKTFLYSILRKVKVSSSQN